MPIIASAIKRVRQQARRRSHNLQVKRAVHQDVRSFRDAVAAGDTKATSTTLKAAISELDRAVKKGSMHRNAAARHKSRLQKQANALLGAQTAAKSAAKPAEAKAAPASSTRSTRSQRPKVGAKAKSAA